jgi:hypothetical protein
VGRFQLIVNVCGTTLASMKHATESTLRELTSLLSRLRSFDELVERRPGVFYRKGKAFLHFHEDPQGVFVDVRFKVDDPFLRLPVTTTPQQSTLLSKIERALRSSGVAATKAVPDRASRTSN